MDEAIAHCTRGIGIREWASNDAGAEPAVVLGCAGDVPTLETVATVSLLRRHLPQLKVRVVNAVDLMRLQDVMGSRCGDLDPMVALYLLDHGMTAEQVRSALDRESGLLALAGTADVRAILGAAAGGAADGEATDGGAGDDGTGDAVLAVEAWVHRARALVAAMAAAVGGLDVLAFSWIGDVECAHHPVEWRGPTAG